MTRKDRFLILFGGLVGVTIVAFFYFFCKGKPWHEIRDELFPHIAYALLSLIFLFLLAFFYKSDNDRKLDEILTSLKSDSPPKAKNHSKPNSKIDEWINRIGTGKTKFLKKYKQFESLMDLVINDRIREIESACEGTLVVQTEVEREVFTAKLFDNLGTLPEVKRIQSLCWDIEDYLLDYWSAYADAVTLARRNDSLQERGISIDRLFIFQRDNVTDKKIKTYNSLYEANKKYQSFSTMKWFYEEDLEVNIFQDILSERSSFLLLLDANKVVRISSVNYQPDRITKPSEIRFHSDRSEITEQKNFKRLWKQADLPLEQLQKSGGKSGG